VRNAGTLGGNLCFSDPHSDPATFLLAAEAHLEGRRGKAARKIPIHEFVRGPYETALDDGELLVEVQLPELPPGAALAHGKFAFHERPAATVSCYARVLDGRVAEARVAVGSVGVVPVRASEAERILSGAASEGLDSLLEDAGAAAGEAADAVADQNGSPEYKRNLVRVLVRRCFGEAVARASSDLPRA
jgi:carbon-monoxide dehydrogenase medium subunit